MNREIILRPKVSPSYYRRTIEKFLMFLTIGCLKKISINILNFQTPYLMVIIYA